MGQTSNAVPRRTRGRRSRPVFLAAAALCALAAVGLPGEAAAQTCSPDDSDTINNQIVATDSSFSPQFTDSDNNTIMVGSIGDGTYGGNCVLDLVNSSSNTVNIIGPATTTFTHGVVMDDASTQNTLNISNSFGATGGLTPTAISDGDGANTVNINAGANVTGDIVMGGGSDVVNFTGGTVFAGSTIDLGGGNDSLAIGGVFGRPLSGPLEVEFGDGDDLLTFTGTPTFEIQDAGVVQFQGGEGGETVGDRWLLNGTTDAQYNFPHRVDQFEHLVKDGSNTWTLVQSGGNVASFDDVRVMAGTLVLVGIWEITGSTTTVDAGSTMNIGNGSIATVVDEDGDTNIFGTLNVTNNATYNANSTTNIDGGTLQIDAGGTYNADFNVFGGAGDDTIIVDGSFNITSGGLINFDLGGGNDTLAIGGVFGRAISDNLDVIFGDGDDLLTFTGTPTFEIQDGDLAKFEGGEGGETAGDTWLLNGTTDAQYDFPYLVDQFEHLVKDGSNTWTLVSQGGGDIAIFEDVTVMAGTLVLVGTWEITGSNTTTVDPGATLDIGDGSTLTVVNEAGDADIAGTLNVTTNATFNVDGTTTVFSGGFVNVDGTLNAATVVIQAGGEIGVQPGGAMSATETTVAGTLFIDGGTYTASGTTTVSAGGEVTITGSGALNATTVDVQGVLTLQGGANTVSATDTTVTGQLTVENAGTYTSSGTTTIAGGGTLTVQDTNSTYRAQGAVLVQDGGTIQVSAGLFDAQGATTVEGTAASESLISVVGGTYTAQGAVMVGDGGRIQVSSGLFEAQGQTTVVGTDASGGLEGSIQVTGGTYTAQGAVTIQGDGSISVTAGLFDAQGTTTVAGGGALPDDTDIIVQGGEYRARGAVLIQDNGFVAVGGGLFDAQDTTTIAGTSAVRVQTAGAEYRARGAVVVQDNGLVVVLGGLFDAQDATTVAGNGTISVDGGTYTAQGAVLVQDAGAILVQGGQFFAGDTTTVEGTAATDEGIVSVDGGTYDAQGAVMVGDGGRIQVTAGLFDAQGTTTVTGSDASTGLEGTIVVEGGTYQAQGAVTIQGDGSIQVAAGLFDAFGPTTITGGGTLPNDTDIIVQGGEYRARGAVTIQDGFVVVAGGLFLAQQTTTLSGADTLLRVQDAGAEYRAGGPVLLEGSSILIAAGLFDALTTTTVRDGATIAVTGADATYRTGVALGLTLDVQGLVSVSGGLFHAQGDTALTSEGIITVAGGTFQADGVTSLNDNAILGVFDTGVYTAGSPITVNGGTVMGTGTIDGGSVLNNVGGTVAPGASIGTLSLVGTYSQGSGGSFEAEVAPGAAADLLAVTGTAQLAGALDVVFVAPGAAPGQQHVILATDAPIDGIFETASLSGPDTENVVVWVGRVDATGQPDVTGSDVALLILAPVGVVTQPETPNQRAVADYLGNLPFVPGGSIVIEDDSVFNSPLGFGVLGPNALDQIGGEVYDAFTAFSFDIARQYGGLVDNRVRSLRCATARGPSAPFCAPNQTLLAQVTPGRALLGPSQTADAQMADAGPGLAPGAPGTVAPQGFAPQTHPYGWSVWASGLGSYLSKDRTTNHLGYSGWTGGGALGVDLALSQRWIVGVLAGGARSDIGFSGVPGDGDLEAVTVGAYTAWYGSRWFADAAFTYTKTWVEAQRPLTFQSPGVTAEGKTTGDQYAVHARAGYGFKLGRLSLEATGGLDWVRLTQDGFTETGADVFDLSVRRRTDDSLRLGIGVRAARAWKLRPGLIVAPSVRVGYARELLDNTRPITASLPNIAGSFTVHGDEGSRNILTYGAGVQADLSQGLTLYVAYAGEWAGARTVNTLTGGLRVRW